MVSLIQEYHGKVGLSGYDILLKIRLCLDPIQNKFCIRFREKKDLAIKIKMQEKNVSDISQIQDIYGFRVIVFDQSLLDSVIFILQKTFENITLKKDYISFPKTREGLKFKGKIYQAKHFVVMINDVSFEIQLLTSKMHKRNKVLHKGYKSKIE